MIYTGQFKNVDNTVYTINIETSGTTGTTQINLGQTPFKVEYNNDKIIYSPLKLSNATAQIITNNYLFDIYSSYSQGTKVTLLDDEYSVIWTGYLTPNIYTQGFQDYYEKIDLECIDGLSTLENFNYSTIDAENKKVKSFQDIIIHIIKQCNCYNNIYMNQNLYLKNKSITNYNAITLVTITDGETLPAGMYPIWDDYSQTFLNQWYDERITTTSNYYYESAHPVTSDVYITVNSNVFFVIKNGYTVSNTVSTFPNTVSTTVITPETDSYYNYKEQPILFIEDTNNILNKLYISEQNFFGELNYTTSTNSAGVTSITTNNNPTTYKDVLNELMQFLGCTIVAQGDSVYILDYDYIKNGNSGYTYYSTNNNWSTFLSGYTLEKNVYNITKDSFKKNGATIELDSTFNQISIKTSQAKNETLLPAFYDNNYLTNVLTNNNNDWNSYEVKQFNNDINQPTIYLFKYYKNSNYTNYYYYDDINWTSVNNDSLNYYIIAGNSMDNYSKNIGASFVRHTNYLTSVGTPATVTYTDYILLHRHLQPVPAGDSTTWHTIQNQPHPVLKLNPNTIQESGYLYDGNYMLISGSALWDNTPNQAYIDETRTLVGDTTFTNNDMKIIAKLRIGNKWWNGVNWMSYDSTFEIRFAKESEAHLYYKWHNVLNTVLFNDTLGAQGQKIPINKKDMLCGDTEFIIYSPCSVIPQYGVHCVWLKDFKIQLIQPNFNKNDSSDTEYKNIVDINYTNKFSDITEKICSDTFKGLNYSVVINKHDDIIENNIAIYNKVLNKNQLQEYNLIEKYVNQYSTPKKVLNITLENMFPHTTLFTCDYFPNLKFIISKMSIDYMQNNNLLTIVEKN